MTLSELYNLLLGTGLPVAYSHFATAKQPPFITYKRSSTDNTFADNKVYEKNDNVIVQLYTPSKDITKEQTLEALFDSNDITYQVVSDDYIDSENMNEVIYEITI